MREDLLKRIFEAVKTAFPEVDAKFEDINLEHPGSEEHGDYSTNIALKLAKEVGQRPVEIAKQIANLIPGSEIAGPGFINFKLDSEQLVSQMKRALEEGERYGQSLSLIGKKIMVEFAHPNTHKELHIGHMRTLTTGEALARICDFCGATVFRANYQGDIGPHVAKAIWGTEKLLGEKKMTWENAEKLSRKEKAHLLGQGYVLGNKEYEISKAEIDELNSKLYKNDPEVKAVYERTRKWSLDYYSDFYERFYTKFDRLYFESDVAAKGKKIVEDNVGKVFEKSEGAIIFDGEKYDLHKRVFITKDGNPTYEGKEMALAGLQFGDFPFDLNIHVVANEQTGYFQVVIKALELLDSKYIGREFHLSMGMVQLVGRKISSRTGELVTVDDLLDDVKNLLIPLVHSDLGAEEKSTVLEAATIGAVKYSVLKTNPIMNSTFDLEKSVSLDGDSGPYIQYTYARAKSVLRKSGVGVDRRVDPGTHIGVPLQTEEINILRYLYRFPEIVEVAAKTYSPNLVCSYLFELSKRFNAFYNNCPILENDLRLAMTQAVSIVIKNGLDLLGITALEKM